MQKSKTEQWNKASLCSGSWDLYFIQSSSDEYSFPFCNSPPRGIFPLGVNKCRDMRAPNGPFQASLQHKRACCCKTQYKKFNLFFLYTTCTMYNEHARLLYNALEQIWNGIWAESRELSFADVELLFPKEALEPLFPPSGITRPRKIGQLIRITRFYSTPFFFLLCLVNLNYFSWWCFRNLVFEGSKFKSRFNI